MHRIKKGSLFDHLVSALQKRFGDLQPERLGGLEVDHQLMKPSRCNSA
jgi:hypothetical protein